MNKSVYMRMFSLILIILVCFSCKKDDAPAPAGLSLATLEGSWAITSGEGTEWQEGVGIITPRAVDNSLVGYKIQVDGDVLTVKDISGNVVLGPITITLNTSTGVINAGNAVDGLGVYTIKNFVAGATMEWDQRDPIAEDYEPQAGCGCNLSFQKFFKFARL